MYKANLSKVDFLENLRRNLITQIQRIYKDPETAFSALCTGSVSQNIMMKDIIGSVVVKKLGVSKEDVKSYLLRDKVFANEQDELEF